MTDSTSTLVHWSHWSAKADVAMGEVRDSPPSASGGTSLQFEVPASSSKESVSSAS